MILPMIPQRIRERPLRRNRETLLLKIQGKIRNLLLQMIPQLIREMTLRRIHQMIPRLIREMTLRRIRQMIPHPILRMILKTNSRKRGRYIPRISLRALSFCSS